MIREVIILTLIISAFAQNIGN